MAKVLETSTAEGGVEVNSLGESVGEGTLSMFASGMDTMQSTRVRARVVKFLVLELLDKMVDQTGIEVLGGGSSAFRIADVLRMAYR